MTTSAPVTTRRRPGRPREFDIEAALDEALPVFRERGYHGASLEDLGAAMKLTPGSIYKAFRDKRAIFLAAFDRYAELRHSRLRQLLEAESHGRDKLRATLGFYAGSSHDIEGRRGCLVVGSAVELATLDAEMAARVTSALRHVETLLREFIRLGQADGSIASTIDADAAAGALLCVLQGLRVIGKTGRTRDEVAAIADCALRLID